MAPRYGLRLWGPPDGAYTNDNPDGGPWVDEIGTIEHATGDFGPFTVGSPNLIRFDAKTNALAMENLYADPTAQIILSVTGPCGTDTPSDYAYQLSNDDWERLMFVGQFGGYKASLPQIGAARMVKADIAEWWSSILNSRPGVASSANTDPKQIIQDIDTAISVGILSSNLNAFPDHTNGYLMDMPASGTETAGAILQKATAPYGMWVCGEYQGTYTGDDLDTWDLGVRPSIFRLNWRSGFAATANRETVQIYRPYLCGFPDYGRQIGAHPNRVRVNGSGGATGTYTHGAPGVLGHTTQTVTSWIDNNTECDSAAEHLIHLSCAPYPRIFKCVIPIEAFYNAHIAAGDDPDLVQAMCWKLVALRPGDLINFATETNDPLDGFADPAPVPLTSEADLVAVVNPQVAAEYGDATGAGLIHDVTSVTRRWHHVTGWTIEFGCRVVAGDW